MARASVNGRAAVSCSARNALPADVSAVAIRSVIAPPLPEAKTLPPIVITAKAGMTNVSWQLSKAIPMHLDLYLGFVLASVVLILIPGPNVSLIVANVI